MRYLFFDTAVNGYYTLTVLKEQLPSFLPLMGKEENISENAAPFLFEVNDEKLAHFLSTEHITFKDILFLESNETLAAVQAYFNRFVVQTINGQEFYFRFWSATVFKKYIATCNPKQLADFFRIVDTFSCDDNEPSSTVRYSFDGRKLIIEKVANNALNLNTREQQNPQNIAQQESNGNNDKNVDTQQAEKKVKRKFFS